MPETIRLADYRPFAFDLDTVELRFELEPEATVVRSRLALRRRGDDATLNLFGCELETVSLTLDGRLLGAADYSITGETLSIPGVPESSVLEVVTRIDPQGNAALEGLYRSGGMYCTQCEAEGFRRITWYPDRPDVMARFTVTVVADKATNPVLLSNGNRTESGELEGGRHWVTWVDPFPKPSYLFALVAGDLHCARGSYTTMSGRDVALEIYVEHHNADKCDHAIASLQKSMAWDEQTFGLEYDLDTYMIVAVDDFNMGAMENKGLNVFNSACVLAMPETATDNDFHTIESIVAHEYFHNWTGNRVTCRDWFQLSLKEGLTVFRDQQFSADVFSAATQRINDVNVLRTHQFAEDAGPMAHPVRPESYIEINNFYTLTVYNKGAEVIRMQHTLLGTDGFRRGMDLYFERHDGQAVTIEEFVAAMADANGADLEQFKRWYSQAGTPVVRVDEAWDADAGNFTLTLRQSCPETPDGSAKLPFHIPVAVGLLAADGRELPLQMDGEEALGATTRVLELREAEQAFTFTGLTDRPVPSLLRGFSAPVRLEAADDDARLGFLMRHDSDPFNRWNAAQQRAVAILTRAIAALQGGETPAVPDDFVAACRATLTDETLEPALRALALTLPGEGYLAEELAANGTIDPVAIHAARGWLRGVLAAALRTELAATYEAMRVEGPYRYDAEPCGRRALRNLCLAYLTLNPDRAAVDRVTAQFEGADNMTDAMAALVALANADVPEREPALAAFHDRWQGDAQVMDKWLSVQATSSLPDTPQRVRALLDHPVYSPRNPNKVRAVVGAFCRGNPAHFHAADGSGYALLGEVVRSTDAFNPQLASRLVGAFGQWRHLDAGRQARIEAELNAILATDGLSQNVFEIVTKTLAAPKRG